ncbi:MAG TPA: outer membrane protein assembly factor BamD [Candidatus Acidoferrales bacterium]|nr:outer membrane protein assembly factor BamD [Candidatus Acidoferrales bacterium]
MKTSIAGFPARRAAHNSSNRKYPFLILCALLAGPFSLTAKAQAVQAQTGSSGGKVEPPKTKPKESDKKIKAHVVKEAPKKKAEPDATQQSVAPDKVLYQRAIYSINRGHYTEGRLSLQTLINTYPDSEYLAKAKLATADSYYKEGGTSGLTQAVEEYKNFIIFFPFLDEAAYAQMQVGMAHFRMMEKPDRDTTQALDAEQEFQTFLLKYPRSTLVPQAEQHLRDVQQVLADGQYRVARFYYLKQDFPASAARLIDLVERYPLYSQTDEALWMLAEVYNRARKVSPNEDEKNHWADLAGSCYGRIVKDYPLSGLAGQARDRLQQMGMAVPAPDPGALARMKKEQMYNKQHHEAQTVAFLKLPLALLKSSPSVANSAHFGSPNLNPPDDAVSAHTVLQQGAKGPDFDAANRALQPTPAPPAQEDSGVPVEAETGAPSDVPQGTGIGVQIITPTTGSDAPPTAQPADGSAANPGTQPIENSPSGVSNINGGSVTDAAPVASANSPKAAGSAAAAPAPSANTAPPAKPAANSSENDKHDKKARTPKLDDKSESSSKKKKGIKKVIPW